MEQYNDNDVTKCNGRSIMRQCIKFVLFNTAMFTEFTEATNEYTDGISRHRLSPYSAYYH